MTIEDIDILINMYKNEMFSIEQFMKRMVNFFQDNPKLKKEPLPAVHSVKYRLKDPSHLSEKITRKIEEGTNDISVDNFFDRVTDLAGIRILHLYSDQLQEIHNEIIEQVKIGELALYENPIAYNWDIDAQQFLQNLGLEIKVKPSYYTSVHYVVMPKENSKIKCEIQVRTLFEEVWGEIDHSINYPNPCESISCREQIKVLAQLSATGLRLSNNIIRSKKES